MASTTKIVTAITVIENADVNKIIDINPKAVGVEGSSIYLKKGDKYSILDLLYGLMLRSGNDSAEALAYEVGGSIEGFNKLMNKTAADLGCKNSNFTNPSGLHNKEHYTSCYDLAVITSYALKNPTFQKIVSAKSHTITNLASGTKTIISNKNKLLFNSKDANGVKTGYTKNAGRCFVGSAKRENLQLVFVTIDCGPMFEKALEAMNKVFDNYEKIELVKQDKPLAYFWDKKGDKYNVVCKEDFNYMIKKGDKDCVEICLDLLQDNQIPINNDTNVGEIKIYYDKQLIFSQKLYTIKE